MKIEYKGVINYSDQTEVLTPENAVKYIESFDKTGKTTGKILYSLLAMLFPAALLIIRYLVESELPFVFNLLGCAIGCVLLLPHELLHGICFPKKAHVELYQMISPSKMFVAANEPMSRGRYIFMRLFPNLILGIAPLIIWMCISPETYLAKTFFSIGFINVVAGVEDYMNITKTMRFTPPFSQIYVSGLKTYYAPATK